MDHLQWIGSWEYWDGSPAKVDENDGVCCSLRHRFDALNGPSKIMIRNEGGPDNQAKQILRE